MTNNDYILNTLYGKERPAGEPTPISEVALGDIVVVHSRGQYRSGLVTKVGKTNVAASYITAGGVAEGQRIIDRYTEYVRRGRDAFHALIQEELGLDEYTAERRAHTDECFDTYVEEVNTKTAEDFTMITNKKAKEFWKVVA